MQFDGSILTFGLVHRNRRHHHHAAAGIRLSTWMVQKVDTLKWILTGIVNPDDDFDSTKRFLRSRAFRICIYHHFLLYFCMFSIKLIL